MVNRTDDPTYYHTTLESRHSTIQYLCFSIRNEDLLTEIVYFIIK